MPKVTIREPAVATLTDKKTIEKQSSKEQVIDELGRVIILRDIDPLSESRLILAVGSKAAINPIYMNMYVFPAARVESIDGDPYGLPQNQAQVDSILAVLGRKGMDALSAHLFQDVSTESSSEEAAAKN
jgi:hypothetical protein